MKNIFINWVRGILIAAVILFILAVVAIFVFPLPGQIPVLMYHFIGSKTAADSYGTIVTERTFSKQMAFLKRFGYRVISIEEYDAIISGQKKPKGRELLLTFDDGNASVAEKAMPIINQFQYPVALFLISENLKTGAYGSMKTETVLQLKKNPLVSFGAHTRTHPFLSQISDEQEHDEIAGAKKELESVLGIPIVYFAYPYGDFDERSMRVAQDAGYRMAFTTSPKKLKNLSATLYSIPRVKISENASNLMIFWVKVSGIYDSFKMWRHRYYQKNNLIP